MVPSYKIWKFVFDSQRIISTVVSVITKLNQETVPVRIFRPIKNVLLFHPVIQQQAD